MMAERDVIVSHTTIMRWVLRYVPEYERWARFARPAGFVMAFEREILQSSALGYRAKKDLVTKLVRPDGQGLRFEDAISHMW